MAYSLEFRKCVMKNIEEGITWKKTQDTFNVSCNTLQRWRKKMIKKGDLSDVPRKPYKPRKIDSQELILALEKKPDATLKELAKQFQCWPHAIHRCLKKLDITRKKTTLYHERNEEKR